MLRFKSFENPWKNVSDLDEFLVYSCPECDVKEKSKDNFYVHAIQSHDNARSVFIKPEPASEENPPETVLSDLPVEKEISIKEEFDPDSILSSEQQNSDKEDENEAPTEKKERSAEPYEVPPMYRKYVEEYEPFAHLDRATFKISRKRKGRRSSFLNMKMKMKSQRRLSRFIRENGPDTSDIEETDETSEEPPQKKARGEVVWKFNNPFREKDLDNPGIEETQQKTKQEPPQEAPQMAPQEETPQKAPPQKLIRVIRPRLVKNPIQCYYCGMTDEAKNQMEMIKHIRSNHNPPSVTIRMFGDVRKHQCEECKMMFQSDSGLKMHTCGKIPPHWTMITPISSSL